MDPLQLLDCVIAPALASMGDKYNTQAAQAFVLGTAMVESDCGYFLRQTPRGNALGPWQCEIPTFEWLRDYVRKRRPVLAKKIEAPMLEPEAWSSERLVYDLRFGAKICRLRMLVVTEPLATNARDLALQHKKYYNTAGGATKLAESVKDFERAQKVVLQRARIMAQT